MLRDAVLQEPVQFSQEQIDLATRAIHSMSGQEAILVRVEDDLVDWFATAQRVLDAAVNVYFSLLLIQAKREQRGILAETVDLACRRKEALACLSQICGKAVTVTEVLSAVAAQSGVDERDLRPLAEPIRRDLARLQTHEPQAKTKRSSSRRQAVSDGSPAVSTSTLPSESKRAPADSNRTSSQSQAVDCGGTSTQPENGDSDVSR